MATAYSMRKLINKLLINTVASISLLILAISAQAHPAPVTEVVLDVSNEMVKVKFTAPINEWNLAAPILDLSQQANDTTEAVPDEHIDSVLAYLAEHFSVSTESGVALKLTNISLSLIKPEGHPHILADMAYKAVENAVVDRAFNLNWTAIVHRVRSHRANIFIASDTAGSAVTSYPTFLGKMHYQLPVFTVRR